LLFKFPGWINLLYAVLELVIKPFAACIVGLPLASGSVKLFSYP
jgi:hypothetical protein